MMRGAMARCGVPSLLLLAGCGGNSNVQFASGGAPLSSTGGSVSVNSQPRSALGNLVVFGALVGISHGSASPYGSRYSSNPFMALQPTNPAPELDGTRAVHEQDCSRPIENGSANLKCR